MSGETRLTIVISLLVFAFLAPIIDAINVQDLTLFHAAIMSLAAAFALHLNELMSSDD